MEEIKISLLKIAKIQNSGQNASQNQWFCIVSLQNTKVNTLKKHFPIYQHRRILKQKQYPIDIRHKKNKVNVKFLKVHSNYTWEKQNPTKEIRKQNEREKVIAFPNSSIISMKCQIKAWWAALWILTNGSQAQGEKQKTPNIKQDPETEAQSQSTETTPLAAKL